MSRTMTIAMGLVAAVAAVPATAAEYMFSFTPSQALIGQAVSGSGVFTTSDVATIVAGRTAYAITGITGVVNGSQIVAPAGAYGNYFTTGGTILDGSGTRFFTASGIDVRFFFQDTVSRYRVNTFGAFGSSEYVTGTSSPVAAAVPEAATCAMMIAGLGLVGFAMRVRRSPVRALSLP